MNVGLVDVHVRGNWFVGSLAGMNDGTITGSFATGVVRGESDVGGLIGTHSGILARSYATCTVTGRQIISGLVGNQAGPVTNSYATGHVSGYIYTYGLAKPFGFVSGAESSYWNTESSGQAALGTPFDSGEGKSTAEMLQRETFEGWDFGPDGAWRIDENATYPYHRWQGEARGYNFPAPLDLTYQPDANSISLTWQAPAGTTPVLGYNVYRDGVRLNTDGLVTQTEYADDEVERDLPYTYHVTAVHDRGGEQPESLPSPAVEARTFAGFAGGDGSEANPWQINTAGQLHHIRYDLTAHYLLTGDIDLGQAPWNEETGWEPIGTFSYARPGAQWCFAGSIDGNGFTITGLTINRPNMPAGLVACLAHGELRNITLDDVHVVGGNGVGSLAGYHHSSSRILNCAASGAVMGNNMVGGLVGGVVSFGGLIDSSHAAVDVSGNDDIGGLVGRTNGTVENSSASGTVQGSNRVGGLAGTISFVRNSFATGDVTGTGAEGLVGGLAGEIIGEVMHCFASGNVRGTTNVGGLVGRNVAYGFEGCYATGNVEGDQDVGGLVGFNSVPILNSYALGDVRGGTNVGGLVGENGSRVDTTYAAGAVEGDEYVGGLIGYNRGNRVTASYWDMETTGQTNGSGNSNTDGITGLTTDQMRTPSSFVDWDFEEVWAITDHETYPWLRNNPQAAPGGPRLTLPGDEAEVELPVRFAWLEKEDVQSYELLVALDQAFEHVVAHETDLVEPFHEMADLDEGTTYYWRVAIVTGDGAPSWSATRSFFVARGTGVNHDEHPGEFVLDQNYPNPFNPSTVISYQLPVRSNVRIDMFDITGRRVAILVNEERPAGYHEVSLDAQHLPAGVYVYRMTAGNAVFTRKLVLLK